MDGSSQTRAKLEKLFDDKLKPILDVTNDLKEKMNGVVHSLEFISSQYDDIKQRFDKQQEEIKGFQQENEYLKTEISRLMNEVRSYKNINNDLEQYTRRDCLEIKGIPQQAGEDTDHIVKTLGTKMGIELNEDDISISHRLPAPRQALQNKEPAIIVKFVRRNTRDKFYAARKQLRGKTTRDLGFSRVAENTIYISESLTKQNRMLFNQCLDTRKKLRYKFIWTKNGKIYMRENEEMQAILISSDKDLQKLDNN